MVASHRKTVTRLGRLSERDNEREVRPNNEAIIIMIWNKMVCLKSHTHIISKKGTDVRLIKYHDLEIHVKLRCKLIRYGKKPIMFS
jgi:hypothetical protein